METVRDRLIRLQRYGPRVEKPLKGLTRDAKPSGESKHSEEGKKESVLSSETMFMRDVDRAISRIEAIRTKMLSDSGQYLSLFYDLKKAEEEFLTILEKKDLRFLDLPEPFLKRMAEVRNKIKKPGANQNSTNQSTAEKRESKPAPRFQPDIDIY